MTDDRRNVHGPAGGDGEAKGTGYGAGGLGAGGDRADGSKRDAWNAPGVGLDGKRTGSSTDGPRIPMDGEATPGDDD